MSGYTSKFITAKVLDLGLVTLYYFLFALVFSILLSQLTILYESYTDQKQKSMTRLMFEIVANIFFVAVAFWIIRNVVERVPFPLDGYGGYQHRLLSTTSTSAIAALTLIIFQTKLSDKIRELNARIFAKATK